MASLNRIFLAGNITRDPDVRNIPNSTTIVATTGIAVNRHYKDKDEVMFIDVTAYGRNAEILGEHFTKGSPILIEGRLVYRQWEQEGQKRSKHEVLIDGIQFLNNKKDGAAEASNESLNEQPTANINKNSSNKISEEDLPF